jgi:hypothetical protein
MSVSKHPAIRALLRQNDDGLTVHEIANRIDLRPDVIRRALGNMPDVYIDRWQAPAHREPPQAVWCAVVPPENCPPPRKQK